MKKLISLVLIIVPLIAQAQHVKVSGGVTISSLIHATQSSVEMIRDKSVGYNVSIGLDYLEHDFFMMSSELGCFRAGGYDFNASYGPDGSQVADIEIDSDNLFVNTTFRGKLPIGEVFNIYVGTGIQLDYRLNYNYHNINLENVNQHGFYIDIPFEGGMYYDIENIRLGLNYKYLLNVYHKDNPMREIHVVNFSIGYSFN